MNKSIVEQIDTNKICIDMYEKALHEFDYTSNECKRLRSCSAYVYETENYYILRSYNTLIAVIDKKTDTCYDLLRYVFGYTATSSQHISKFIADYGYHNNKVLRFYRV